MSQDRTTLVLALADICGADCTDVSLVEAVKRQVADLAAVSEIQVSFQNVFTLSTSFANALLLYLEALKRERPALRVRLCDLTNRHAEVLKPSIAALRVG